MSSYTLFVGFLFGAGFTALGFMFYIDTKLKPQLSATERKLCDLEHSWSCSWALADRLSEVAIADKQKAAAARAASVIRSAVQEALDTPPTAS
jgi:hypothetical protein